MIFDSEEHKKIISELLRKAENDLAVNYPEVISALKQSILDAKVEAPWEPEHRAVTKGT